MIRVWNLQTGQARVLKGTWGGPVSISFSPDGRWIAAADSARANPAIRLSDLETGAARILGHCTRQVTSVAFSPEGESVASGSWDEVVPLGDVRTGATRVLGKDCSCICCLSYSPRGDKVAACSLDRRIRVWDTATAKSRTVGQHQCRRVFSRRQNFSDRQRQWNGSSLERCRLVPFGRSSLGSPAIRRSPDRPLQPTRHCPPALPNNPARRRRKLPLCL